MSRGLRLTPAQFSGIAGGKRPKFGNKKRVLNGIEFDSTREARRYQDLELMQRAGTITDLRRQVPYPIFLNGTHVCDWFADFVYREAGAVVVEDSKGHKTDIYRLKKKLVEAEYRIKIRET